MLQFEIRPQYIIVLKQTEITPGSFVSHQQMLHTRPSKIWKKFAQNVY